ncbi:TonB-dependent receptor domain-containing protein [Sphingomonas sp. RIT328]|uniref:TonB-dependent receptor domain-containing protein n=1 Tax=Sphingomonas sp. RIT328 TaxID=1470591 RepID=UPI000445FC5E|nr:TonB-dependent receptor [Sphingomonas sp. RIT328]EZP56518.1 TonB-dependent receptor precursor [Sphingomonas sp. RIT328]
MKNWLFSASALAGGMLLATNAFAQTAPDTNAPQAGSNTAGTSMAAPDQDEPTRPSEEIVITGSRIRSPNAVSVVPITTVSAAELTQTARTSIGDVLNDLPQLQSTYSQSNSTRFLGTGGLNLLDLRGLGTSRTLVVVNGRRHVGSDILNNAVSVDVNTIPTDLIEGVDLVTGGNSAVYGSDAIAGVVNFRLKQNFEGLQIRAQGGVSDEKDAGSYFVSLTGGKNFADGRGNLAVNLEYARTEALFASDRKAYRQNDTFVTTNVDAAGVGVDGKLNYDGVPDAVFFRNVRSATIFDGGLVSFAGAGLGATSTARCGRDPLGRAYTCNYLFQPGGSLIQETGTRVGIANGTAAAPSAAPAGSFIGGNGNTRREGTLVQLLPQLDRYSANLVGHFAVSDAFVPFVEAKYVRVDSVSLGGSGPAFYTGSTIDALYERPRLDNPFLSADASAALTAQALLAVNNGINPTTGAAITAAQAATLRTQINSGAYRFILRKNLTDLGSRREDARRETYRIVGGVRGDFADTFNYEVSANYGEFKERTRVLGNVDVQRLSLALDAVRNPATGQIVCGAQLDASRFAFGEDVGGNAANLANDIANCQPLNPFGVGSISDATRNYVLRNTVSEGKITQLDLLANLSGDSSKFFNLPGGAVGFSIGAEYRRETNYFQADPYVQAGYTFYNALARFDPPSFEVKEAFGELRVPLLKDITLLKEVTVGAAGRVSDYKGSAGTVYTYNLNGVWAPVEGVRLRANYGRSVRAPNLSELYASAGQNFAPGFLDPCSADNLGRGTQFRAANCAAAGIPTSYNYQYVQSLEILSGGNANLRAEKSDSYTYGAVISPTFAPGLILSVDYYNIKVNNVINSAGAQATVNNCYDSPSITNNQFCNQFTRVAAGATGPNGEQSYRIIEGALLDNPLNYASLKRRGIDANLSYAHSFGGTRLSGQVIYTHLLEASNFLNPLQPGFADTFVGELGYPKDQVTVNLGADFGLVTFDTQFRYLSKQSVGVIENRIAFQGRPAQNLDDFDIPFYPDVLYIGAKLGIDFSERSTFYLGVDNLTDRLPPLGATGIGAGSAIFDNIGRRFYAGVTARF